jgi:hypothetical protein
LVGKGGAWWAGGKGVRKMRVGRIEKKMEEIMFLL